MRDSSLDIVKGVLIFLVVFGHFLERLIGWGNEENRVLLSTIYFVHMPAFIFISGMLFKTTDVFKKVTYFVTLLIPFQIAYVLFNALLTDQISLVWLMQPYWILWYLCGMIAWTLITPLLLKTQFPVLIAIALSILIGLSPINNYLFSIGRIFTFLPFFVIGHLYGRAITQWLKAHQNYAIYGVLVFVSIALISQFSGLSSGWLFGSLSYKQLGVSDLTGSITRLSIFMISILGVVALLSLSLLIKDRLIDLGQHTLPVYLLHGFVVIVISRLIIFPDQFGMGLFICLAFSIITCFILKLNIFDKVIRFMSSILMCLVKFKH